MNCSFCGRITRNKFCNDICLQNKEIFDKKPFKVFNSIKEASIYFNLDRRALLKYNNIKFKIIKQKKKAKCIDCFYSYDKCNLSRSSRCKECLSKNLHRIAQGRKISNLYKGSGNPNYIDGKSVERNLIRGKSKYKKFVKENKKQYCEVTGFKDNLELHHILPVSLFPEYSYCTWNVITLCSNLHYELHKQKIDVQFINSVKSKDIKDNFIEMLNNIKPLSSIKIEYFNFIKCLIKNYNSYVTKEVIQKIKNILLEYQI